MSKIAIAPPHLKWRVGGKKNRFWYLVALSGQPVGPEDHKVHLDLLDQSHELYPPRQPHTTLLTCCADSSPDGQSDDGSGQMFAPPLAGTNEKHAAAVGASGGGKK
eukprot:1191317-Prorocentrum_minimum.AAC.4